MNFDEVLCSVGEFNRYQKWLLVLVCVPACLFSPFSLLGHVFVSAVPPHYCKVPSEPEKVALFKRSFETLQEYRTALKTLSIPTDPIEGFSQCQQYASDVNLAIEQILRENAHLNSSILNQFVARKRWPSVECLNGWNFDTGEFAETIATKFEVVCDRAWLASTAQSLFFVGGVIGTIFFGWMSDRWGRRPALLSASTLMVVANFGQIVAPNYMCYIVIRFISGLSFPSVYNIAFVLVTETIGPSKRSIPSVVADFAFSLGMLFLPCISYFLNHWQAFQTATSLPMLMLLSFYWALPESPRWLATKGKMNEAQIVLTKMAVVNGVHLTPNSLHDMMADGALSTAATDKDAGKLGISQVFRYPRVMLKIVAITLVWTFNAMIFHGMSFVASILPSRVDVAFAISAACALVASILGWITVPRYRRKSMMLVTLLFSAMFTMATGFVPKDMSWLAVILPALAKFSSNVSFTVVYLLAGELLPTVIRGLGINIASTGSQLGMVLTPYIIYSGTSYGKAVPFVIHGIFSLLAIFLVLPLPETLNMPLPATLQDCENYKDFLSKRPADTESPTDRARSPREQ